MGMTDTAEGRALRTKIWRKNHAEKTTNIHA